MTAASSMAIRRTRSKRRISGPSRATRAHPIQTGSWSPPVAAERLLVAMPGWRAAASAAFGGITLLAACQQSSVPPKLTLRTAQFGDLTGWTDDNVAAAIPAFVKSCQVFLARGDDAPLDPQ